ncbi:MAG: tetratricopeptide repeat protein [Clostridium sp.]
MSKVNINLLGYPCIDLDGEKVNFPYKKVEGFLYYLCVKKSVTREEIICLLWGDEDETTGKKKLRDTVYQVRRFLDKDFLITSGHTGIALNPNYDMYIDWDHVYDENTQIIPGIFLEHFFIKNSYEFEEWIEGIRAEYRQKISGKAREQLMEAQRNGDISHIQEYSNILIKSDPYNEDLYYEIMNMYAESGNYTMAIRLYYDLQKSFHEEMEMEPSQKIKDLFHRVFNVKEHVKTEGASMEQPFIGRKKELYEISGFLEHALGKRVNCVIIKGEEGAGKTSLMECGLKLAAGHQMIALPAVCYRQGADFFLSPWNDVFQELKQCIENGAIHGAFTVNQEEKLRQLLDGAVGDDRTNRRMTYQTIEQLVVSVFTEVTKKYKVVLAFDDMQWMDRMSIQLLSRLLFTIEPEKLLVICTYSRNYEAEVMEGLEPLIKKDCVNVISLQPFTKEETNELLHKILPELDAEPEKQNNIYEATEGNAFFLKELVNLIREKGYTLEKSPKTNYVIKARLSGISEEEKEVLDCMSVFPEKISVEEIELLLTGMDRLTLLKILERLQENFLIKEVLVGWNVYYKFVHRVFQEYIYEMQSMGKRQLYHRILAEHYETQARANQKFTLLPLVVYHYDKCHNQVKSYQYQIKYLKAYYTIINENFPVLQLDPSDIGEDFGVMEKAAKMLQLAENVIKLEDDSAEIRQMKMEMYYIKGRYDIAMGEYDSGIANIEQSIILSNKLNAHKNLLACYKQLIFYGIQKGDPEKMEEYVELGLNCIGKDETDEYATFLRLKGLYYIQMQEYEMAAKALERAIIVFKELEDGEKKYSAGIAACYNYIGDIYKRQERYEEALPYYMKALEEGKSVETTNGMGQVYSNLGQMMYHMGNYGEACRYLTKAEERLERNGYRWGLERVEAYFAMTYLKSGDKEEAKKYYEKSIKLSEKIANPITINLLHDMEKEIKS